MKRKHFLTTAVLFLSLVLLPILANAQGTLADYERAQSLRKQFEGPAINLPGRTNWIEKRNKFWYRKAVKGGNEFVLVDAETLAQNAAFDQERLAVSLSTATGAKYKALDLPFMIFTFADNQRAIEFIVGDNRWKCDLINYNCTRLGAADRRDFGQLPQLGGAPVRPPDQPRPSPDTNWQAFVKNYNIYLRPKTRRRSLRLVSMAPKTTTMRLLLSAGRQIHRG